MNEKTTHFFHGKKIVKRRVFGLGYKNPSNLMAGWVFLNFSVSFFSLGSSIPIGSMGLVYLPTFG